MANYYSDWCKYSSGAEGKQWNAFTKHIASYMTSIVNDHELVEVEGKYDGIPFTFIRIQTYHKNKPYKSELQIAMSMAPVLTNRLTENILDIFLRKFRQQFLGKSADPVTDTNSQIQDASSDIVENPNFLEVLPL